MKRYLLFLFCTVLVVMNILLISLVHHNGSINKNKSLFSNIYFHENETKDPIPNDHNTADNTTESNITIAQAPFIRTSSCITHGKHSLSLDKSRHIIIIGAMSFIGSRLAMYFHGRGYHILAVEDLECVDNHELKWYRWSQLAKERIPVQVIMLSRKDKLMSLLNAHSPQAIIYVPTKVNGMERIDHQISSVLRNYVSLLMNLKKHPKFVLISHATSNIEKKWMTLYETFLSSLYPNEKSSIVKANHVHGPWQDSTVVMSSQWYIDDVGAIVLKALTSSHFKWNMDQCNTFITTKEKTLLSLKSNFINTTRKWLNEYEQYILDGRPRNVSIGAYVVNFSPMSQYGMFPVSSRTRYFFEWFRTARNHGLSIVIFHDTMTSGFQKRLKDVYSKTETIHISPVSNIISNDQRFYFIYDYLLKHDDINMAIATDIRDVDFPGVNPIQTMSLIGDRYIFAGLDIPFYLTLGSNDQTKTYKTCFPSYPTQEVFHTYRFFNNGVLGGTRSMLLTLLVHVISHLDISIHYNNWCCDMSTVQFLLHTKFAKDVFVGYPFNSAFFIQTPGPKGLSVRHKPEYQLK